MTDQEKIEFIEDSVLKLFKKSIKLSPTDNLLEVGLDSLDVVELQVYYEEITANVVSNDSKVSTVAELMALMK
jgi:aryl carrier-like protein